MSKLTKRSAKLNRAVKNQPAGKLLEGKVSKNASHVVDTLKQAGFEAYIVGGAVRDLVLGRVPKDYDLATDATPEEVKQVFGRRARIIGRRFRLAHVYVGRSVYEVSTFRREPTMEERKGRPGDNGLIVWRDNVYGTLEDDACRRDFTVNALYYDPTDQDRGIIDYCGGFNDLRQGVVRTIGDPYTRLAEDPVRILRACKLVGQYGFKPSKKLASQLEAGAESICMSSMARLLEEIYKILKKPWSGPIFAACQEVALLQYLLPDLAAEWDHATGGLARDMLDVRDRRLAAGDLYPSRVTGMAMIMVPFLQHDLGHDGPLWRNFNGIDRVLADRVRDFYGLYKIPRYSRAKIRDVLLLQSAFLQPRMRRRLTAHEEYSRARDVFEVYVTAAGLKVST